MNGFYNACKFKHGVEYKKKFQSNETNFLVILVPNENARFYREKKVKVVDRVFESMEDVLEYLDSNAIQARLGRDAIVFPVPDGDIYSLGKYKRGLRNEEADF